MGEEETCSQRAGKDAERKLSLQTLLCLKSPFVISGVLVSLAKARRFPEGTALCFRITCYVLHKCTQSGNLAQHLNPSQDADSHLHQGLCSLGLARREPGQTGLGLFLLLLTLKGLPGPLLYSYLEKEQRGYGEHSSDKQQGR